MKNINSKSLFWLGTACVTLVVTISALVLSVSYIVYKVVNEHHNEQKWKDYDGCGLA